MKEVARERYKKEMNEVTREIEEAEKDKNNYLKFFW